MKCALLVVGAFVVAAGPAFAQNKSVKIGFVSTFSGPTAAMGNDMRNSFELALHHLGRNMGGVPVEVIYEDDQQRPDVGKQKTDKLIELDKVDFIVGYIWSNVLLASIKSAIDSKTFLITSNAGPHQIAGGHARRAAAFKRHLDADHGLSRLLVPCEFAVRQRRSRSHRIHRRDSLPRSRKASTNPWSSMGQYVELTRELAVSIECSRPRRVGSDLRPDQARLRAADRFIRVSTIRKALFNALKVFV